MKRKWQTVVTITAGSVEVNRPALESLLKLSWLHAPSGQSPEEPAFAVA